jgi:hypothetical protein
VDDIARAAINGGAKTVISLLNLLLGRAWTTSTFQRMSPKKTKSRYILVSVLKIVSLEKQWMVQVALLHGDNLGHYSLESEVWLHTADFHFEHKDQANRKAL